MKPPRSGKRWTPAEDQIVLDGWAEDCVWTIARKVERSPRAILERAQRLKLGSVMSRYHSMDDVERILGVHHQVIRRLAVAAGITLYRMPATRGRRSDGRRRYWGIDDDQVEALAAELRRELAEDRFGLGLCRLRRAS